MSNEMWSRLMTLVIVICVCLSILKAITIYNEIKIELLNKEIEAEISKDDYCKYICKKGDMP